MARARHQSAAAYARALLDLANERGQALALAAELQAVAALVAADSGFALFLRSPTVSEAARRPVLERIFAGRCSELLLNLLRVMNRHGRLGALAALAVEYQRLLDEQEGNLHVEVTVAAELETGLLEEIGRRVGAALRKRALPRQKVDPDIIGGLVLRVGDKLIDGSVRCQLERCRQRMLAAG
jgi:F-type H+-transporting ATPase subunit delta